MPSRCGVTFLYAVCRVKCEMPLRLAAELTRRYSYVYISFMLSQRRMIKSLNVMANPSQKLVRIKPYTEDSISRTGLVIRPIHKYLVYVYL